MTWEELKRRYSSFSQLEEELLSFRTPDHKHWQIWEAYKKQISRIVAGDPQAYEVACTQLYNAYASEPTLRRAH